MQQALQNPHYKKIWEKVIMNRHPEAKSLGEALELETKNILHCEVLFAYDNIDEIINVKQYNQINLPIIQKAIQNGICKFKILGRPITLEDVAQLWYATCIDTNSKKGYAKIGIYDRLLIPFVNWQLTKPLHEQTPETLEKISNLID